MGFMSSILVLQIKVQNLNLFPNFLKYNKLGFSLPNNEKSYKFH